MAIELFKDGGSKLFSIDRYKNAIEHDGWRLTEKAEPKSEIEPEVEPEPEIATESETDTPTFAEADTNNSGKLSPKEIREAAREAGIPDWDKARIKRLKRELGYDIGIVI